MPLFSRRKFLSVMPALLAGCGGGGGGETPQTQTTGGTQTNPPASLPPVTIPEPGHPTPPPVQDRNVIQLENAKTAQDGVTSRWYIESLDYASNREIEGYASSTSVRRGESIQLFVNTAEPSYSISIYRIGWYGGQGGRLMAGPIRRDGVRQPAPTKTADTRLVECNWTDPYVLSIPKNDADPTDWASGFYLAKLTAGASGKQSYIIFVVRDDARDSALLFQSSVTTYAAYNNWGGHSFYSVDSEGAKEAYKVSFNRPYRNPQQPSQGKGAGDFFSWELHMLRFVEREGYDVTYTTNIAVHLAPESLEKHRGFLSVGHDEYWTGKMFDAMEHARDKGVNLGFFGANMGYWQVRLEPSTTGQSNRTVVGYKYARWDDPNYYSDPGSTTYHWREKQYPAINRPEATLIGVMYDYNSVDLDMVMSDCSSWICEGTGLRNGAVLKGMLGYEVDRVDPVHSPANIQILASSPYQVCVDEGCPRRETRYANMTFYTAASGAGVFATGTMQWNWGLDDFGPWGDRVNPAVQRMTRNVLDHFVAN
ncbi:MAG: hypothetical protein JWM42_1137 [Burkholderia sp.]|nr:hypothetical protein [Burkholderia sp.]